MKEELEQAVRPFFSSFNAELTVVGARVAMAAGRSLPGVAGRAGYSSAGIFNALLCYALDEADGRQDAMNAVATDAESNSTLVPVLSPSDSVRGSATIKGTVIANAELTIKAQSVNRGHLLKTVLAAPLNLDQLQTAHNHLSMALESLQTYFPPYTKETIVEIQQKINMHLKAATLSATSLDRSRTFPRMVQHTKTSFINTSLPDDVFIQFHISHMHTLVVSVYTVHLHTHGHSITTSSSSTTSSLSGMAHTTGSNMVNHLGGMVKEQLKKQNRKRAIGASSSSSSASGNSVTSMLSTTDKQTQLSQLPDGRWVEIIGEIVIETVVIPLQQHFTTSIEQAQEVLDEISVKLQGF